MFNFSLEFLWLFTIFPISLSQTLRVSLQKSFIFASFLLQSSRKRYGFPLSHLIFHVLSIIFLIFELFVVWDILCSNMFLLRLLGIWLSDVFIVCFLVVIYWSTLYCDNIGSLMTHEHSLSFSRHSHPVVRVFFIIHMLTLTHC